MGILGDSQNRKLADQEINERLRQLLDKNYTGEQYREELKQIEERRDQLDKLIRDGWY